MALQRPRARGSPHPGGAARGGAGAGFCGRGVEIERNIESAGHALTQQDRERERVLEQERALERQRAAEREGPSHGR